MGRYLSDENAARLDRAYMLKQQAKELVAEADEILEDLASEADKYIGGEFVLNVYPNRRFDPVTARKALPPERYSAILKEVPNAALAKAVLTEEEYEATQRVNGLVRKIEKLGGTYE